MSQPAQAVHTGSVAQSESAQSVAPSLSLSTMSSHCWSGVPHPRDDPVVTFSV